MILKILAFIGFLTLFSICCIAFFMHADSKIEQAEDGADVWKEL